MSLHSCAGPSFLPTECWALPRRSEREGVPPAATATATATDASLLCLPPAAGQLTASSRLLRLLLRFLLRLLLRYRLVSLMSLQTVHLPGPAPRQDSSPFDSLFGTPAFLQAHGLSFSKDCTAIPNPVFHSDASRVTGADNSDAGNGGDREGDPASSRGTSTLP